MPLVNLSEGRDSWREEVLIQISESMVGRALRTPRFTYCVADRTANVATDPSSTHYDEYQMYDLASDPHQLVNLAGRQDNRNLIHAEGDLPLPEIAADLRQRLVARMVEAGEAAPQITPSRLYP